MTLALYRKYRPRSFAEMIGQEHVTEPLSQALRTGRLNHAYLFSGPRGCGKTSSARILARSLNCEKGPTPDPCGECDSCRALAPDGPGSIDVIEIDAASHGGVDDARDLRERAFFAPVSSRFKVYIIDEAHMVSSAGFNALLKLVEEPPEYVKFVFATTEPEKVLGTIKSRTHHYPFRLFPPSVVRPYIEKLSAAEGVKIEPPVFPLVVRAGGGSMRDTLSVLDQLIGGAGPEGVTYARAVALLGVTDVALIDEVCDALAAGDGAAVYTTIDRVAEAGHDARRFAGDLLERLRNLIVLQQVPDAIAKGLLDGADDELERMAEQAQRFGAATLSRMADIVHTGLIEMRGTTAPRLVLELISARMLLPGAEDSSNALLARMERLERRFTLSGGDDAAGRVPAGVDPAPRSVGRADNPPAGLGSANPSTSAGAGATAAGSATAVSGATAAGNATSRGDAAARGGDAASGGDATSGGVATVAGGAADGSGLTAAGGAPATGGAGRGTDPSASGAAASGGSAAAANPTGPGLAAASRNAPSSSTASAASSGRPPIDATPGGSAASAASSDPAAASNTAVAINEARQPSAATAPAAGMTNADDPDAMTNTGASNTGASNAVMTTPDTVTPDPSATMAARTEVPAQPDGDRSPGAPGAIDAAAIRRIWGEVLTMVRQKSRKEAAYALDANVRDVVGNTLVLLFKYPLHAEAIATSPTNLQDALYEILGIRFQIRCDVAGQASGPAIRPAEPAATSSVAANRPSAPANVEPASADDDWPTTATLGGSGADGGVTAPAASAPAVSTPAPTGAPSRTGTSTQAGPSTQTGASAQAGGSTQTGAPAQAGGSARAGAPTRPGAPARQSTGARTGASTRSAPSDAPGGGGRTAARAAASGRGTGPGRAGSSATKPGADDAWAGSAGEEPPYDPEFDPPPAAVDHIGFDPGDEPVDDDAPGAADRPTSEQQAIDLLRDALGAEKIG